MRFLRTLLAVALLLAAAYFVLTLIAPPRPAHAYAASLPSGTAVLAHQGGDDLWPSNTMLAFENAVALGADVLELDVHLTADGRFVVIHDATVDRTTDGTGAVAERTLDELKTLDAGFDWLPDEPAEGVVFELDVATSGEADSDGDAGAGTVGPPYRGMGLTIPTLSEVLAAFPNAPVNVEIKQDDPEAARALCGALRSEGATGRVMVGSFHAPALRAFRAACPEVATSAAPREVLTFFILARARLHRVYSPPFEALQVPIEQAGLTVVTPHFVEAAHQRGVDVHVWTIDDVPTMNRLVALGVDGLITDRPDRALRVLGRDYDAELVPAFVRD
jgi:glycerophosphoryl diester phosphodiesterase